MTGVDIPQGSIVRATWRKLLEPKRLFPILLVSAALLYGQWSYSRGNPFAVPLGVALIISFVLAAPVSYRVLFPEGLDFSHGAVRVALYGAIGAGTVLTLGVAVPKLLELPRSFLTDRVSLVVSVALFLVGGWGLGRDIEAEARVQRLQDIAERAQLLALRAHLEPHFLFNTLNAIAEWCRTDGAVAEAAVLKLSAMLRSVLEGVRAPRWPLAKELELVDTLFALHLLRDKELFTLERSLPSPLPALEVPPMSVLTLAENAVKHGPGKGHRGVLNLTVRRAGDGVELVLENPGPFSGPRPGSDGVPTLERRLALSYGPRARLTLEALPGPRTRATLTFPLS